MLALLLLNCSPLVLAGALDLTQTGHLLPCHLNRQRVQQQLTSTETAGKNDDSPVTVADYGEL
jgi:hypothetical protein